MLRYSPLPATLVQTLTQSQKTVAGNNLREHEPFRFMCLSIRAQKPREIVSVLSTLAPDFDRAIFASLNIDVFINIFSIFK